MKEGTIQKGGTNNPPKTKRPKPPKGQYKWEPSKADVIDIAEKLIEECVEYGGDRWDYCRYCLQEESPIGIIKHKLTCVVLKALDVTTK